MRYSPIIIGALLTASLLMYQALSEAEPICKASCDRISVGMKREDVIALLGKPPDSEFLFSSSGETWDGCFWHGDEGSIRVDFQLGKVAFSRYFETTDEMRPAGDGPLPDTSIANQGGSRKQSRESGLQRLVRAIRR